MFEVIVWATDGSPSAEEALPFAAGLAKSGGARLVIVHVDEVIPTRGGGTYHVQADETDVVASVEGHLAKLRGEGIDTHLERRTAGSGGAAHTIADAAREADADLIVVGTRGHGSVAGLILGSVTHRLLHIAPCPVLVVPAKDNVGTR
jgi:nucleotide-binding universal stress UspA family protein